MSRSQSFVLWSYCILHLYVIADLLYVCICTYAYAYMYIYLCIYLNILYVSMYFGRYILYDTFERIHWTVLAYTQVFIYIKYCNSESFFYYHFLFNFKPQHFSDSSLRSEESWPPRSNCPLRWRLYRRLLAARGCCGTSTIICVTLRATSPGTTSAWKTTLWTGSCSIRLSCSDESDSGLQINQVYVFVFSRVSGTETTSTLTSETCTSTWGAWDTSWRSWELPSPALTPVSTVRSRTRGQNVEREESRCETPAQLRAVNEAVSLIMTSQQKVKLTTCWFPSSLQVRCWWWTARRSISPRRSPSWGETSTTACRSSSSATGTTPPSWGRSSSTMRTPGTSWVLCV